MPAADMRGEDLDRQPADAASVGGRRAYRDTESGIAGQGSQRDREQKRRGQTIGRKKQAES